MIIELRVRLISKGQMLLLGPERLRGATVRWSKSSLCAASDVLGLWRTGELDYRRIADLAQLSRRDLSKMSGVSPTLVRFDQNIPWAVAECLREIGNIVSLVGEFFKGDVHKVGLWFELENPQLGGISPRAMICAGRHMRLLNFVLEARVAEQAAVEATAAQSGRKKS